MTSSYKPPKPNSDKDPEQQGQMQQMAPARNPAAEPWHQSYNAVPPQPSAPPTTPAHPGPAAGVRSARPVAQQRAPQPPQTPVPQRPPDTPFQTPAPQQQRPQRPPDTPAPEGGPVILHRSQHFYVRTTYRPGLPPTTNPLRKPTGDTQVIPRVMPQQKERIVESDTRIMPVVTAPIGASRPDKLRIPLWLEVFLVFLGLTATALSHAINMFNYPRYELDEGTYISSAWSLTQGQITPYAYGYGHPPLAWMQLAGLVQLFGGNYFLFGNAINTGRVLILLFTLGSTMLVYLIVRRLCDSRLLGILAIVFFALSPISITYQRLVLLDNIGTFWMLLSLYFIIASKSRLKFIALGGVAFGFALLSKEVFVMFIPAMMYGVWLYTTKFQRKFSFISFTYVVVALGSGWVLMAILKGELFPFAWHLPWDTHTHLSLLDTFVQQAQRSGAVEGGFEKSWFIWSHADEIFMYSSVAAMALNIIAGWWNRKQLLFVFLAACFWALLLRGYVMKGGVVFAFYLIPLIPILAINIVLALQTVFEIILKVVRLEAVRAILIVAMLVVTLWYDGTHYNFLYNQQPTSVQTNALVWLRQNAPRNAFIVINSYLYLDLHVPGGQGVGDGAPFPFAHVYYNVVGDPEIKTGILQKNWDRIDYLVADSEMLDDINGGLTGDYKLLKDAMDHSKKVADFIASDHEDKFEIQIYQVIHQSKPPTTQAAPNSGGSSNAGGGQAMVDDRQVYDRRLVVG